MFADRKFRIVSYHDTWMSLDPIRGCPFQCSYCVLRDAQTVGTRSEEVIAPKAAVRQLLDHHLFVPGFTPVAIGNETDMFHRNNKGYLVDLLTEIVGAGITNPIILITKAPLDDDGVGEIRRIGGLRVIFFLSYSGLAGLGQKFEPNFTDEQLRSNFAVVARYGFPIVHYWRPLLPENTGTDTVRRMLIFVSGVADASVLVGLKLNPQLSKRLVSDGLNIPPDLRGRYGEWIEEEAIERIHEEGALLAPDYPLYRHSACALAKVLHSPTVTGTVFRDDICPPSHCPAEQRGVCERARRIASEAQIAGALRRLGRPIEFERHPDRVLLKGSVNQEEFSYLLHQLRCPIEVEHVDMQNLYYGSIFEGQVLRNDGGTS